MDKLAVETISITSPAFSNEGLIPVKYTCDGENINPPLNFENLPVSTKSLALIVDDPDAPVRTWDHWLVWNIRPRKRIKENSVPGEEGLNSFQRQQYGGPCPPSGKHRYFFKAYALDIALSLPTNADKQMLEHAMSGHILAKGQLIGVYKRMN